MAYTRIIIGTRTKRRQTPTDYESLVNLVESLCKGVKAKTVEEPVRFTVKSKHTDDIIDSQESWLEVLEDSGTKEPTLLVSFVDEKEESKKNLIRETDLDVLTFLCGKATRHVPLPPVDFDYPTLIDLVISTYPFLNGLSFDITTLSSDEETFPKFNIENNSDVTYLIAEMSRLNNNPRATEIVLAITPRFKVYSPPEYRFRPPIPLKPKFPNVGIKRTSAAAGFTTSSSYMELKRRRIEKDQNKAIWMGWREGRLEEVVGEEQELDFFRNAAELAKDPAYWYSQICLVCLKDTQYVSLKQHLNGKFHLKKIIKDKVRPCYTRTLIDTYNVGEPMPGSLASPWSDYRHFRMVGLQPSSEFMTLLNYQRHENYLVMGEQDFSYSLAIARLVGSHRVVGTSYLGPNDEKKPDINIKNYDDGARRDLELVTLQKMEGDLSRNLREAESTNMKVLYNINARDLQESLVTKYHFSPFDCVVFPFPRMSLKRGCDPNNSVLIRDFFKSSHKADVLKPAGRLQIIMLINQFKEWDTLHLGEEAGWRLQKAGYCDFSKVPPYRPRDVTGNPINRDAIAPGKAVIFEFVKMNQ